MMAPTVTHFVWPLSPLQGATPAVRLSRSRGVPRLGSPAGARGVLCQPLRLPRIEATHCVIASFLFRGRNCKWTVNRSFVTARSEATRQSMHSDIMDRRASLAMTEKLLAMTKVVVRFMESVLFRVVETANGP